MSKSTVTKQRAFSPAVTDISPVAQPDFLSMPDCVRRSPLLQQGGFAILTEAPALEARQLLREAVRNTSCAELTQVRVSDQVESRGGSPARRFMTTQGSQSQDGFYHAPQTLQWLRAVSGLSLLPTGGRGTFTYYRPGDYLALHRDVLECDLAVITCLADTHPPSDLSGALCLYPDRWREPLSGIRATPETGAVRLRLPVGQTIVMLGGIVPHAILPMAEGQLRIVSILCYQVVN